MNGSDPQVSVPPAPKWGRYLFALLVTGSALYFFLPRFADMGHAAEVISNLRIPFVVCSAIAQLLSYLGSGYLLITVANSSSKPVSILEGAAMTASANSIGTLGGGAIGTAGMTYHWLHRRGVSSGKAALGGWLPIILNEVVLSAISLAGLILIAHLNKSTGLLVTGFTLTGLILGSIVTGVVLIQLYRNKLLPVVMPVARFVGKLSHKHPMKLKSRP